MRDALAAMESASGTFAGWTVDSSWGNLDGSFLDILPLLDKNGFRLHFYRDVDNVLKVEIRTRSFVGGRMEYDPSQLADQKRSEPLFFGIRWSEKGASLWLGPAGEEVANLGQWGEGVPQGK